MQKGPALEAATFAFGREYDYNPFWAKAAELKPPLTWDTGM